MIKRYIEAYLSLLKSSESILLWLQLELSKVELSISSSASENACSKGPCNKSVGSGYNCVRTGNEHKHSKATHSEVRLNYLKETVSGNSGLLMVN